VVLCVLAIYVGVTYRSQPQYDGDLEAVHVWPLWFTNNINCKLPINEPFYWILHI